MEKLKMESTDKTLKNIDRIGALFPNVITEMKDENGKHKKGINFELLKQELSGDVVDGEECYDFTWVGKKTAIVEGNTPIRKTLRPCIEESKNWEDTGNLYIEGDNLDVLKLLQESYLNSIKMIYIDPPYNTGNDYFVYRDNFNITKGDYDDQIGLLDEDENRLFKNTETNGRFHSDWCSMVYPRLKLAHNLLSEDGVIFISIDDNEVDNLSKICKEIFGESNFVAQFTWKRRTGSNDALKNVSIDHEYIICYSKTTQAVFEGVEKKFENYTNPDNDPRGVWTKGDLTCNKTASERPNLFYSFIDPKTKAEYKCSTNRVWAYEQRSMQQLIESNKIIFPQNGKGMPMFKRFQTDVKSATKPYSSIIDTQINSMATKEIQNIFDSQVFSYPKTVNLLTQLVAQASDENSIILDFFSGSATTAHAVLSLNSEDGGNRRFIMVQLPEKCEDNSEAGRAGYKNICEIGKERIRRAGDKINEEIINNNAQLKIGVEAKSLVDTGFRVLKIDSTNMKDVYYAANEYNQLMLAGLESNIKEDRTDLDLLYGVLLDWGLPLSLNHKIEEIDGVTVHTVDKGSLVACFADKVSESVVRQIAKHQPLRVVFRDSSFANSPDKINVEEIFKLHAPNTTVKVI